MPAGVYRVQGQDPEYGSYRGTAEIRPSAEGSPQTVCHVHTWDDARFEGDRIALAWEGIFTEADAGAVIRVRLDRVGFLVRYGEHTRDGVPSEPLVLEARPSPSGPSWTLAFTDTAGGEVRSRETWTPTGPNGSEPVWRNKRQLVPAHDPPSPKEHALLFATFGAFHELPELQPYVDRPEFRRAVHYAVFDPTDFEFARANPDVVRVIQKTVDPISLAEARIRQRAYRQTLAQKAAVFDAEVPVYHLNRAGLIGFYDTRQALGEHHWPDVDGIAWTGDYAASQAMRLLLTGESAALTNLLRAVRGIIRCYDIAPGRGDYARTIRDHEPGTRVEKEWRRGTGEFAGFDWLSGANNDMLKGIRSGFLWAHIALRGRTGRDEDEIKRRMPRLLRELIEHNADAGDGKTNEAYLQLLLYALTDEPEAYARYLALFEVFEPWLVDWGNGGRYEFGVSDWSGNYMHLKTLVELHTLERHLGKWGTNVRHVGDYEKALAVALNNLRHTRLGFFQLAAATLGRFDSRPPELDDAIWVLREFSAPKLGYDIDWRIHPSFCMSPVPYLPWKMNWVEKKRVQSLVMYPLFERNPSNIEWKARPTHYRGQAHVLRRSGVDYLRAYWFGRYHGVITPDM